MRIDKKKFWIVLIGTTVEDKLTPAHDTRG